MIRQLLGLAALVTSGAVTGQPVSSTAPSAASAVDGTTQTQDIRFRNDDDRLTVPVRLSGSGPYQFLVDTGADRSAVSRDIVDRLKLQALSGAELHSLTGVSNVATARVQNIALTRDPEPEIEAAVLEARNMGADGIVGSDLLSGQRVQFDFTNRTMSIVPSYAPDPAAEANSIIIRAKRKNGRLIVTDAVAGGQSVTMVLDTGAEISMGNEVLHRRLLSRGLVDTQHDIELNSVTGGTIKGDYMVVPELETGGVTLQNVPVVFVNAHTFKQLKLEQKPALLLGMNAIRAFKKVSIDFANRRFRVVLPEHSAIETRLAMADRL
jgi:predicted aspartyl protease